MNPRKPIKAISFDGDQTLWDFEKVMHHSLGITLQEIQRRIHNSRSSELTVEKMIKIRDQVSDEYKGLAPNLSEIRYQAFCRTLDIIGASDNIFARELYNLFIKHRYGDVELYPYTIQCLDLLRQQFRIGLLSNGNSFPERCGLNGYFNFVIFAHEVGVEKPDPRMFLEACKQAGCKPSELMQVGDSLRNDVLGANDVGAVSVWLNRDGERNETGIEPDFEIRSLVELPQICNDF